MINSYDPRGPIQKVVAVEVTAGPTWLTLDCGHISQWNPIYTYQVGEECRCFHCGPNGSKPKGVK